MSEPILLQAGEGGRVDLGPMGSGSTKAGAKATDGSIGAWEFSLEGGGGAPPPHVHHGIHEFMYIVDGEAELILGDRTELVSAGAFLYAPPGTTHGVSPSGSGKLRALIIATPADEHERVVDAMVQLVASGPPTPETMAKAFEGVDIEVPQQA